MILCDASPLVALIDQTDRNHNRCRSILPDISKPMITTWACLVEAMYLLGRYGGWTAQKALWKLVDAGLLILHIGTEEELARMKQLMEQYRDTPMDLADASLVAAAETLNQKRIFTLDSDFQIYRLSGNVPFEIVP